MCLQVRCCPGCVGVYRYDAVRGVSTGTMLPGVCGCLQVRCCPGCVGVDRYDAVRGVCIQVRCCPGCVGVYRYDAARGVWVSTGTMLSGVCLQVRCCPGCVYRYHAVRGVRVVLWPAQNSGQGGPARHHAVCERRRRHCSDVHGQLHVRRLVLELHVGHLHAHSRWSVPA